MQLILQQHIFCDEDLDLSLFKPYRFQKPIRLYNGSILQTFRQSQKIRSYP